MTVFSKRNIILPGPDGQKFCLEKGKETPVPVWAEKSAYLKALEADGKVIIIPAKTKRKPNREKSDEKETLPPENTGEDLE